MKSILAAIAATLVNSYSCQAAFVNAWFNEFHYDNADTDSGEFIEVAVPSDFTDLGNLFVTLYDGDNGGAYIANAVSGFTLGSTAGGYTLYYLPFSADGIQNGPDGFALSHSGTLIQFLSYEGTITAVSGVASGNTSVDIGLAESDPGTAVDSSLGLTGSGSSYLDFSWTVFPASATPGALNVGQTIVPVPEPAEWGLICAMGLLSACGLHAWQRRRRAMRQLHVTS
jgi:hypothetical protein